MHYYQFNIGDYIKDTTHLEPMEDLAYRRMMDLYYSTGKALPSDIEKIARLIRMRSHSDCIAVVLEDFFTLEGDAYHQARIDAEISAFKEKSVKASKSAKARWKKPKVKQEVKPPCEGNANAVRTDSEGNAKHKPLNTKHETLNINKTKGTWEPPEGLNLEAWQEYEQHRKDIKKPMTNTARSKAANQIIGLSSIDQQSTIDKSIASRWAGLFPDKITAATVKTKEADKREQDANDWANNIQPDNYTLGETFEHEQH